jgi:hypothetical protein
MNSFCAKIILPKNYKPKLLAHKSCAKKLSYEKAARKILVKSTPDVLSRVTIRNYAAGLVLNNNCTNTALGLLNRL